MMKNMEPDGGFPVPRLKQRLGVLVNQKTNIEPVATLTAKKYATNLLASVKAGDGKNLTCAISNRIGAKPMQMRDNVT